MELTSAMKTKLRSVRVLVVGPEGLLSVYSPKKQGQLSDNNNNSQEANAGGIKPESAEEKREESEITVTVSDSSLNQSNDDDRVKSGNDNGAKTTTGMVPTAPDSQMGNNRLSAISVIPFPNEEESNSDGMEGKLFELRRVSLIHQKSLVIAELQWNQIGNNPSQEYLITWELNGGGLKGHLVTDSTSVTLSLWPDTLYQIQVNTILNSSLHIILFFI